MNSVLLVDDDAICNYLATKVLQKLGVEMEIHTAVNGKEALNLFNSYYQGSTPLPAVILLDLNMPIMDGFGFIEAFRRLDLPRKDEVRIIILSSSTDPADVEKAKTLGVNKFLSKPLREDLLRDALNLDPALP
jgi:CheY-like chemotaxis protein